MSNKSDVSPLKFYDFMFRQQVRDEKKVLRCIVEYLNIITAQLVDEF